MIALNKPKTLVFSYWDYLEATFDWVSTESIGKSYEGQDMRVLKVTIQHPTQEIFVLPEFSNMEPVNDFFCLISIYRNGASQVFGNRTGTFDKRQWSRDTQPKNPRYTHCRFARALEVVGALQRCGWMEESTPMSGSATLLPRSQPGGGLEDKEKGKKDRPSI